MFYVVPLFRGSVSAASQQLKGDGLVRFSRKEPLEHGDAVPHTRRAIIDSMAQLIVRNLDDEIVTRLRQRAARHRRSTEAEHREILRQALVPSRSRRSLKEHLLAMPDVGTDEDFERAPDRPRKTVKL